MKIIDRLFDSELIKTNVASESYSRQCQLKEIG
jgi:hypothetical protein